MAVKVYFDCKWKGPKVDVDANGEVTKIHPGDVGEFLVLIWEECHWEDQFLHHNGIRLVAHGEGSADDSPQIKAAV
jgi:hypothetical protein